MARLRIRIELSRGGVGVPLGKLASVVDEAQKFLGMLAEDVHIDSTRGEWQGFDFANESLNFTAEFSGAVTADQVRAFYAAFDGTTALRRATIGQFARITSAIAENELIGFGLYAADDIAEPSEWRCLSRRDALRIADEINVLSKASGEEESHLPAVTDAGSRLFGRVRDDESSLAERLTRVERRVEQHSAQIHDLRTQSAATEDSFRNLLSAVENFCDQAAHQIERATPAAGRTLALDTASNPAATAEFAAAKPPAPAKSNRRGWLIGAGAVAGLVAVSALLIPGLRQAPSRPVELPKVAAMTEPAPAPARPVPAAPESAPPPKMMQIELQAMDPSWVTLTDADGNTLLTRLLTPGDPRTIEVDRAAKLRTGNAGGLTVKLNGKSIGPLGPRGKIREVEFSGGGFKIRAPQ